MSLKELIQYIFLAATIVLISSCSKLLTVTQLDQKKIFTSLDEALESPNEVYILYLKKYADTINPEDLLSFKNIQALYILSPIDLDTFPDVLSDLDNLQWISIKDNNISFISKEIWSFKHLESIDLAFNQITHFPIINRKNKTLCHLNIDNNDIEIIPPEIKRIINLEYLGLSNNKVNIMPEEIGQLKRLKGLNLANNQLESLPSAILNNRNIASLDLSFNKLVSLPDSMFYLSNSLRFLRIEGNNIAADYALRLREQLPNTKIYYQIGVNCVPTYNLLNGKYQED